MCGRFHTSHLNWRDIHEQLSSFLPVRTPPVNAGWLSDYHDRAPVILEEQEWTDRLDPTKDAKALMAGVRPERFEIGAAA